MKPLLIIITSLAMLLAQAPWAMCRCGCASHNAVIVDSQQGCADCCSHPKTQKPGERPACPCRDCPVRASLECVPPALADSLTRGTVESSGAVEMTIQCETVSEAERHVASAYCPSRHAWDPPLYTLFCLLRC